MDELKTLRNVFKYKETWFPFEKLIKPRFDLIHLFIVPDSSFPNHSKSFSLAINPVNAISSRILNPDGNKLILSAVT